MSNAAVSTEGRPYYLYRWFDSDSALLYVGISTNPAAREARHWATSWWSHWAQDVLVDASPCGYSRAEAEDVERRAIDAECPVFNRAGNPDARDRAVNYIKSRGGDPVEHARRLPATSHRSSTGDIVPFDDYEHATMAIGQIAAIRDVAVRGRRAEEMLSYWLAVADEARKIRNEGVRAMRASGIPRLRSLDGPRSPHRRSRH